MRSGWKSNLSIGSMSLALTACGAGTVREVSKSEFEQVGLLWPLIVEQGRIGCSMNEVWFEAEDGTKYGLNGTAIGSNHYAEIEPIWAEDKKMMAELKAAGASENAPPMRLSIGDMIAEALKLCA